MPRRLVVVALVLLLCASSADAGRDRPIELERANHTKMRAFNVGITAFFTVFSAMRQGQIKSWRDVPRYLLIGSGAGAAFYEAKRLAGRGNTTAGWLIANATTSVVENTTAGEHPVGRIGYTVGPLRLRVATPYVRKGVARVDADWSLAETVFLGAALLEGERIRVRNGLIAVDRDTPWPDPDNPDNEFFGRAFGVFPGVVRGVPPVTWHHEIVHVIQNQQMDSVEFPVRTWGRERAPDEARPLFALRHVRLGWTHIANAVTYKRDYGERWGEVEAYWLAEGKPVQR
jgi:hypothetical protein